MAVEKASGVASCSIDACRGYFSQRASFRDTGFLSILVPWKAG